MYIKITEENLDYINKVRKQYNTGEYTSPVSLKNNFIHVESLTYDDNIETGKVISFKEFKQRYPLEEINKIIMVITHITKDNIDIINEERKRRRICSLDLEDYPYIKENFYAARAKLEIYTLVSFEEFKQITKIEKNSIIELW